MAGVWRYLGSAKFRSRRLGLGVNGNLDTNNIIFNEKRNRSAIEYGQTIGLRYGTHGSLSRVKCLVLGCTQISVSSGNLTSRTITTVTAETLEVS
jgi:hypothetical protein